MSTKTLSQNEVHQLRVYHVRMYDVKDELKLKMRFNNEIKLPFGVFKSMDNRYNCSPILYILDLVLQMKDGTLYVEYEGCMQPIIEYHLEISRTGRMYTNITHEEKGSQGHSLKNCYYMKHYFLFDIQFSSKLRIPVPGKNFHKTRSRIILSFFRNRYKCLYETLLVHLFSFT